MSKLIEKILKESEEKIVYTGINNLNNELDLNSIDSVKNFCIKHAPKKFFKNGKLKMDKVEVGGDLYTIQELIEFMMDQYNIASDSEEIEIYRSLNLKNIKEINFKNYKGDKNACKEISSPRPDDRSVGKTQRSRPYQ